MTGEADGGRALRNSLGLALLVVVVLPFVIYAVPQVVGAEHAYVVRSDSMKPAIRAGDVIVVNSVAPRSIHRGDVITYTRPGSDEEKVTHRVVERVRTDGTLYFRTRGDANEEPDAALVPAENVVGRLLFTIPRIGWVISFGQSRLGIVTLVIGPAVLLVVNEVVTLYRAMAEASGLDGSGDAGRDRRALPEWDWTEDPEPPRGDEEAEADD